MTRLAGVASLTVIIVSLSLYLTACGNDEKNKPSGEKQSPAQITPASESPQLAATTETKQPETSIPTTTIERPASKPEQAPTAQQPAANNIQMLSLARKSGCFSCHSVDKKLVGPAWKDVASRYKNNKDARARLIVKVSKGGRGNWTDVVGNVAMPPYSPRVSMENIERLVDFVLSL